MVGNNSFLEVIIRSFEIIVRCQEIVWSRARTRETDRQTDRERERERERERLNGEKTVGTICR